MIGKAAGAASLALALGLLLTPGGVGGALGAGCDEPSALRFERGAFALERRGATPARMPDCWTLAARAGQRLTVLVTSPDDGAVLQIYAPPWRLRRDPSGARVDAEALPGAEEGRDIASWDGRLPKAGAYLLVIGRSFGGGPYELRVEVR